MKHKRKRINDPNPMMFGEKGIPIMGPTITLDQIEQDPEWQRVFIVFYHAKTNRVFSAFPGAVPSKALLSILEELTANYRNSLRTQ